RIAKFNNKQDWDNRPDFIDQSLAKTLHQTSSIRVLHAGYAAYYMLLLICVCLRLVAHLPPIQTKYNVFATRASFAPV
uniref:Gustatory receptor n=1 Tax=Mesocestoides corti TaxID=53468 RepID=A0A5K3FHT9_MESCO